VKYLNRRRIFSSGVR